MDCVGEDQEVVMGGNQEEQVMVKEALGHIGWDSELSRRGFVKLAMGTIASLSAWGGLLKETGAAPLIITDNADGLVIGDATKCVGCLRCELACTEFNDGKAAPSMARIKVGRNLNFGPSGVFSGQVGRGVWGNGLVVQDICKQCPHPVPCANACPQDAIVADSKTGARVVDSLNCIGCRMCQRACPWGMMSFDPDTGKASKCFLCEGAPKCVEACPADALKFVSWRDVTGQVPARRVPVSIVPPEKAAACMECHKE
jgi:Fe-S-cluster-containing dehydrogenase component